MKVVYSIYAKVEILMKVMENKGSNNAEMVNLKKENEELIEKNKERLGV